MKYTREELEKLDKKELIKIIFTLIRNNIQLKNNKVKKAYQIKNMRMRIRKIMSSLDYLLEHPRSRDSSYRALPHKRDIPRRQKSKLDRGRVM